MVEPKAFQDALLAYHARPGDAEAEAVRAAVLQGAEPGPLLMFSLEYVNGFMVGESEEVREHWKRVYAHVRGVAGTLPTDELLRKADGVCFYMGNAYDGEPRRVIADLCEEIRRLTAGVKEGDRG